MGRNLTAQSPIFFICGTPSDRYGFEYKVLDGRHLPDQSAKYLDNIRKQDFPERGEAMHILRRIRIGASGTAIYAEYRRIHPNDSKHNRGAYIAVGCWIEARLTSFQAMEALYRIATIHSDLAARRNPDTDAFLPDFQLSAYIAPGQTDTKRDQWADVLCQATTGTGVYKDKHGSITLTSEQVRQGALETFLSSTGTPDPSRPRPAPPRNRSWHTRLQELMQEAMNETPRTHRALQDLLRLEEDKTKLVKTVIRTLDHAPRAPRPPSPPGRDPRIPARSTWKFTGRDALFSTIGAILGLTVALGAVVITNFLTEEGRASTQPTIENDITPSSPR